MKFNNPRPLWNVHHPRKRFDKESPRVRRTADAVVESFKVFYALVMHGPECRIVIQDGHDYGSPRTLEMSIQIAVRWVRQECRSQDRRLLRQDRIIVPH